MEKRQMFVIGTLTGLGIGFKNSCRIIRPYKNPCLSSSLNLKKFGGGTMIFE
jgi:hypothetical protein